MNDKRAKDAALAGAALLITPPHEERKEDPQQVANPIHGASHLVGVHKYCF